MGGGLKTMPLGIPVNIMNKLKPAVFVFLIMSSIITLFPPFQWGNERLRTIEERKASRNIYSDILPVKEYNFIFSPFKKDFTINNNIASLNRELITSEIILEYLFAIIFSSIFYFLYVKLGGITFGIFIYFILVSAIILFWSVFGKDFIMLFNPSYDIVLNKENEVEVKYKEWINSFSAYIFINGLKEINNSYPYGWNDSTKKVWKYIKGKIEISDDQLPKIYKYTFPYRKEKTNDPLLNKITRNINRYSSSDYYINKKEVLKYYPAFVPPSNRYLAAGNLLADIDKIKYDYFKNKFDIDITYLKVRESYFQSQIEYKVLVDKIKTYTTIFFILFFIILLFYKKSFIAKYLSRLVNA